MVRIKSSLMRLDPASDALNIHELSQIDFPIVALAPCEMASTTQNKDFQTALKLRQLIEDNFRQNPRPAFYSEILDLSVYSLNRLAQFYFCHTIYSLQHNRRLLEAKFLLRYTMLSVKEISFELEICDSPYLVRWFKQHIGMTPKKYRRKSNIYEKY